MTSPRSWAAYPPSYRAREMALLLGWAQAGESASVIGLAGSGKSNLLGFLCHRPDVVRLYLPHGARVPVFVLVDLSSEPPLRAWIKLRSLSAMLAGIARDVDARRQQVAGARHA